MKNHNANRPQKHGSVLIVVLIMTGILGFSLMSYLALVSFQNRSVVRSQIWNATIPLVEAGIEEALAHLNTNTNNLYSQGWKVQYGYYYKRRNFGEGRYTVAIAPTPTNRNPFIIECSGWLPKPPMLAQNSGSFMAQLGYGSYKSSQVISRTVRVTVGPNAFFPGGMITRGPIDMNGNGISSDIFDSGDSNYSNPDGSYTSTKRKNKMNIDFPLIASNQGDGSAFDAGNANIFGGKAGTGAGGNIDLGPNGKIGGLDWMSDPSKSGIEPGFFIDDINIIFRDIIVPYLGGFSLPAGGSISETNYSYGYGATTVGTLPSPVPSGIITTNYGAMTAYSYPTIYVPGTVSTSAVIQTSTIYPINPNGLVTTNTKTVSTTVLPSPIPSTVSKIVTNILTVTTDSLPSPLPLGAITPNASTTVSSSRYPLDPMPDKSDPSPSWSPPNPGSYVGEIFNTRYENSGSHDNKGWWHDYYAINNYTYAALSYDITYPDSYSYANFQYIYSVPQSYNYTSTTSTNTTVTTESYDTVLDSRDYQASTLNGTIYVRGHARLHVTGSFAFTGGEGITIGPNGSLEIYMTGPVAKIGGNGVINKSGRAANFLYYGTSSNTEIEFNGNGTFIGAIYAPNAAFKLGGGGNNNQDFIGASVTASVFMNGGFQFHYDEDLERSGPRRRYTITSWNEIGVDDFKILGNNDWVYGEDGLETD